MRRAAPTNATVLITGESGVGKELVARAIHRNSNRRDEAFIQVNCAAIPEELIESELFGHEKGSFTGATEKQIGKFELAHKGTIFLDEVGDMSLRTQAKVLRVLQEGEVERIGSQKTVNVDVRVIAATNKDLETAIEKGDFREDLYFRLNVIPINVPPLRERPEDIVPLVSHFVKQFASESNFRAKTFNPAAMETLKRHAWRGNVRELRNTIERLLIMAEGDEIGPAQLSDVLRRAPEGGAAAPEPAASLQDFKAGAERSFLVQKLRENRWNISATAAVHRDPALEPLQEARAVPDHAGEGRLAPLVDPSGLQAVEPDERARVALAERPHEHGEADGGRLRELRLPGLGEQGREPDGVDADALRAGGVAGVHVVDRPQDALHGAGR